MYYIGIDLGTSSLKLLLADEAGEILNTVSKDYPLEFPKPGWSQQAPEDWHNAVMEGIPQLLEGFDGKQVAGIGAGGQMHGLVVLDAEDRVIRPAILWNDGRTAKQVEYLNNEVGKQTLSELTANIAFAGFTAPKILWMREIAATIPMLPVCCCWMWKINAGAAVCWKSAVFPKRRCRSCMRVLKLWARFCRKWRKNWDFLPM